MQDLCVISASLCVSAVNVFLVKDHRRGAEGRRVIEFGHMFHETDPQLDVQRLMHEIRANVAQKSHPTEKTVSPVPGPANGNVKSGHHYHVNDLLRFHGEDFVRNAYHAILCREPDQAGMAHYVDGLASGRFNKVDVLASMHSSPEGQTTRVQLDGLSFPVAVRRLGRLPLIGYLVRVIVSIARLPRLGQYQSQFEFYTWSQQRRITERQDQQHKELNEALHQISAQILELTQRLAEQQQAHELSLRQYEQLLIANRELENIIQARLAETRRYIDESTTKLSEQISLQFSQQLDQQLTERINSLRLQQQKADLALLMQERRLTVLLEQVRQNATTIPNPSLGELAADEDDHLLDALYASFEDQFRGPRDEVRQRLEVYVPILKEAGIADGVLDIGCGRGEWLQLLNSEGIEARGVDHNRVFVEDCRRAGLKVTEQDGLAHLRSLPDESLNAVTIFHVAEHLPFKTLIKWIDETVRTLRPGGMLIAETPNPENFMVGSCSFYADPTHRNPIPSQTLQFLLQSRGLENIKVLKLRPWDAARIDGDSEIVRRFNEYFYGAPDYGIVARKPSPSAGLEDVQ
jgi:SAM-dependent methyltransferase